MDQTQPVNISFLQAKPEDSQKLASLAEAIWRQHFTSIIGTEQVDYMLENFQSSKAIADFILGDYEYFFINIHNSISIGYLAIQNRTDHLHLSKLYLLEKERGKGYGKKAMAFIIEKAKSYQLSSIRLVVNKDNSGPITTYKKLGFKIIGTPVTDIGGGFVMDDYEFELKLD